MLTRLLADPLYIRVRKNRFIVRRLGSPAEAAFDAQPPFTTARLLIGQFQAAESTLKKAVKEMSKGGLFAAAPPVLIQPLELIEGGLSEIEERVLREVAMGAGASRVVVWVGHELTDAEAREKLDGRRRAA